MTNVIDAMDEIWVLCDNCKRGSMRHPYDRQQKYQNYQGTIPQSQEPLSLGTARIQYPFLCGFFPEVCQVFQKVDQV